MPARQLTFNIVTNDAQTIAALRRMQSEIAKTGGVATRQTEAVGAVTGKVSGYVKGLIGLAAARSIVEQGNVAQVTLAKTEAVIKSTGNAAGVSAGQQAEMVKSLAETAGVLPQIVAEGANMERTFTNIKGPQQFGRVLADGMDLAAARGKTLAAVMPALGRAMQDPVHGLALLTRNGITFTDEQKRQIKTMVDAGDAADAQGVILKELETRFGGAAKASATASGRLAVSLQEVEQNAAKALAPIVKLGAEGAQAFSDLPGPIENGTLGLIAFAAVAPKVKSGLGTIRDAVGGVETRVRALSSTQRAATAAQEAATVATTAAAQAEADLDLAVEAGTATEAELTVAIEAETTAREAQATALVATTAAEEELATANTGLLASLGPIGIALAAVTVAYEAFKSSSSSGKITGDANALLGATRKELAGFAAAVEHFKGEKGFEEIGAKSLPALKAMRDAVKATGGVTTDLDTAIRKTEATNERAARAEKKYGSATDDTTTALRRKELAEQAASEEQDKATKSAVDGAIKERDAQQGVIDAHQQTIDDTAALAKAQQAAKGNSDEYRSALEDIASAEKDEASAKSDVISAEQDLSQAEIDAKKRIEDLTDARVKAIQSERDAVLALHEAEAENRKVLADPRSSALDKEKASVALADAKDNESQASKDVSKAQADENAAKQAGIEGDKGVVDAKQKVADAQDKVRESIGKVADAQASARKILHDAAAEAQVDSAKVQSDKAAEAKAWFDLASQTNTATGAALIYYALLKQMGADPALQALLAAALNGVNTGLLSPQGQGELPNRPQGAPHAPGSPGRAAPQRSAPVSITIHNHGTDVQTRRKNDQAVTRSVDRFARATR